MLKDEVLDCIAQDGSNVAQFVSYGPNSKQRFHRIEGLRPDQKFDSIEEAIRAMYRANASCVNIRTFLPDKPDGNPFLWGPRLGFGDVNKAAAAAREMIRKGYYIIINEEIDIMDGGFSGVLLGDWLEFASKDIPRCVEKPGCTTLSRSLGFSLIEAVYGFYPTIPYGEHCRVELTICPNPVGYRKERLVIWQVEDMSSTTLPAAPTPSWPNRYSKDMGDKTFGLLMAHLLGFPVPYTHVFGRLIPHFAFGRHTNSNESGWLRTCPSEQEPGRFTTKKGWCDPFKLTQTEDPEGKSISSVLWQEGVWAKYSGAAITDSEGLLIIEGKEGRGDSFMVGEERPLKELPLRLKELISKTWHELCEMLGPVRFEWVYDGLGVWIVQLHVGRSISKGAVIYPGEPELFIVFPVSDGLERLRERIQEAKNENAGIVLKGDVGITSHFGDLLRRNEIPSRIEK